MSEIPNEERVQYAYQQQLEWQKKFNAQNAREDEDEITK